MGKIYDEAIGALFLFHHKEAREEQKLRRGDPLYDATGQEVWNKRPYERKLRGTRKSQRRWKKGERRWSMKKQTKTHGHDAGSRRVA